MKGRIIKGIAGFYYVYCENGNLYECKARGIFRKDKKKPLVGDACIIELIDEDAGEGSIIDLLPRKNELIRPNVANVDQAMIVFSIKDPVPSLLMLDKLIIQYEKEGLPIVLVFNKEDLREEGEAQRLRDVYKNSGCFCIMTSTVSGEGLAELRELLKGKTTTVSGPSGVGKSSLINALLGDSFARTGALSEKTRRGKHTTRHSEIIPVFEDTYIIDTPGFGSFELYGVDTDEIKFYYKEFDIDVSCRFNPCSHTHEPGCGIKKMVEEGHIDKNRYENYLLIYDEMKSVRRY
ncbi:MAG: ribosome small subunit-dependent GTPase A [Lachnospiraceae bacterium]|nr:ribosome small subunit-dependent GTPase A [Lachnospiraceae bacterium]